MLVSKDNIDRENWATEVRGKRHWFDACLVLNMKRRADISRD